MARIPLTKNEGYVPIPEGRTVFKVLEATYDEDFGRVDVVLVTENGKQTKEKFQLITSDGEVNEGANKAFGYFARVCVNDFDADEVDTDDLVGCYLEADVQHDVQPNKNDTSKTVTFIRLKEWKPATGFVKTEKKSKKPDLSKLL